MELDSMLGAVHKVTEQGTIQLAGVQTGPERWSTSDQRKIFKQEQK